MLLLAACSDDKAVETGPLVGVANHRYTLANDEGATVTLAIKALEPVEADVDVPIVYTGAEEGTDFTASARAFHFAKGATEATLTLTRKAIGRVKTLLVKLQPVNGVRLGIMNYSQVDFAGANIYSFTYEQSELSLAGKYQVEIEDAQGKAFTFATETAIDVDVDPSSTAVLGTHFNFANNRPQVVFPAGSKVGYVSLEYLALEEGHDKIVLNLRNTGKEVPGNRPSMTIKITGPLNFAGTWEFDTVANKQWMRSDYGAYSEVLVNDTRANQRITFKRNGENYTYSHTFTAGLQNYFGTSGGAVFTGTENLQIFEKASGRRPPEEPINIYNFENINLSFSPVDKDIQTARIGLRLIKDETTGEERLEMTIDDYFPTEDTVVMDYGSTWKGTTGWAAASTRPRMITCPFRIRFKKVQ